MLPESRLVSLWEMIRPYVSFLGDTLLSLKSLEEQFACFEEQHPTGIVGETAIALIGQKIEHIVAFGRLVGLKASSNLALHIRHDLKPDTRFGDARALLRELIRGVTQELAGREFFFVRPNFAHYYNEPLKDWGNVPATFPSSVDDVEEASRSLALERYSACVYHLMLVMEAGLRALAGHVRIRKRAVSWDELLRRIDLKLKPKVRPAAKQPKKTEKWRKDEIFIGEAAAHLRAVKVGWRNPDMHVIGHDYNDLTAEDVLRNVRAFMAHLATTIREKPK